jgi:vacuolar-type H+-ATPase subunit F/Vma7
MNFFCIADKESSLGFKFLGMEVREVSDQSEALSALGAGLARSNVGIIIITESISMLIRKEIDALLYRQELPLILEVASRGQSSKRKSAGEFLKAIIGVST